MAKVKAKRWSVEEKIIPRRWAIGFLVGILVIGCIIAYFVLIGRNKLPSPSFTYSPLSPTTLDNLQFTDTSSDEDGHVVSWLWDFGDGTTLTDQNPTHRFSIPGNYMVTLTVKDDDGAKDTYQIVIIVTNPHAPSGTYIVYSDNTRVPLGADIWSWPNIAWQGAENDVYVKEEMGAAPEGVKFRRTMLTDEILGYAGWGVIFVEYPGGSPTDFSSYRDGHLVFWLRGGNLECWGNETGLTVQLEDNTGGKRRVSLIDEGYWTPNENWQEISIPISAFSRVVDLTRINYTFQITLERAERYGAYFDVDYIRWVE